MRRGGFSLVHCLIGMSVFAVLIAIVISTLLTLIQTERHVRRQRLHNSAVWRLSRQLRDDVHAARDAELRRADDGSAEMNRLILHVDDNTRIEYRIETGRILRTKKEGEAIGHRESYPTLSHAPLRWESHQFDGQPVVTLSLPRGSGGAMTETSVAKNVRITAIVGADRRFLVNPNEDREQDDG